jgi:hypothetical protein
MINKTYGDSCQLEECTQKKLCAAVPFTQQAYLHFLLSSTFSETSSMFIDEY